MLSLIEVRCPHCHARGRIVLPPVGAIIVGPCPECKEFVLIFCGQTFALIKDVIVSGSPDEKRTHLMTVLTEYLEDRISELVAEGASDENGVLSADFEDRPLETTSHLEEAAQGGDMDTKSSISQSDFDRFVNVDLQLLDDKDYFKSIFD